MNYTADFETTTDINDCRVWAWGVCDIANPSTFIYGNDIESFLNFMMDSDNSTFYFHNLKFDGEFIIHYLLNNGYTHILDRKDAKNKTFTTLISDMGAFYSIKIYFKCGSRKVTATIYDSLKILPFSVDEIAKGFKLPISKLKIDYHEKREKGHELTEMEIDYLRNDVEIVARALSTLFEQNLKQMTQGSNALYDYKNTITKKKFKYTFPILKPDVDHSIRQSYKGGFTYLSPRYKNKEVGKGIVLDVNSLYPSVMYYEKLPFGDPIFFKGEYKHDELYPLYVICFRCNFELKKNHIPTLQLKNNRSFIPTEYVTSSNGEDILLTLTSVDYELMKDHYNLYNVEYIGGWKFKSTDTMFKEYIDKWSTVKINSKKEGNHAMYILAKLMLNALYGKFALNPNVRSKIPYLNEDNIVKYRNGEPETRDGIYIPVGTFVTAYARNKTIRSAQKCYDRFIYADTDSLHLEGLEVPEGLEVHDTKLGAWKLESTFDKARFIRQKCYIEINYNDCNCNFLNVTCAGMPSNVKKCVSWDNFKEGAVFHGKKLPVHTKGGIILKDYDFTIKI